MCWMCEDEASRALLSGHRRHRIRRCATAPRSLPVLLALVVAFPLAAAEPPPQASSQGQSGGVFELFPAGDPYAPYAADPYRRAMGVALLAVSSPSVPEAGESRLEVRLGGRFGLMRWEGAERRKSLQLGIEVGFYGQFDNDQSQDNIGWDGFYGLIVTAALGDRWALQGGAMHTSAHIGDELAERTGLTRINYTREEALVGASFDFARRWRSYGEVGWGYELRNEELQEPGRVQWGIEYDRPTELWRGRFGWYTAADLQAREERSWRVDATLGFGLRFRGSGRAWRIGVEVHDGPPPMGEFFQSTERSVGFSLWLDP